MRRKKSPRVLVTAGPTRAYLDDVRYLSNFSTGTMGYEICKALKKRKIKVCLVSGPCPQPFTKLKLDRYKPVVTHDEMHAEVLKACKEFKPDVAIFSAAVLDFAPIKMTKGKVSSSKKSWTIKLKPTKKIIDEVYKKYPHIKRIGFKLEVSKTRDFLARSYFKKKHLDLLVLNFLSEISHRSHKTYVYSNDKIYSFYSKQALARWMSRYVETMF